MEACSKDLPLSNAYSDSDDSKTDDDVHEETALFSDDEEIIYKNYDIKKKTVAHKTFCNISEEDAETFFDDDFENSADILVSSDSDSDIEDTDISIDTYLEEHKNVSESESMDVLTRVICTILVLWQSVYNVSDSAVEAIVNCFLFFMYFFCSSSTISKCFPSKYVLNVESFS